MNKILRNYLAIAACLFFTAIPTFAETSAEISKHSLKVGLEIENFEYNEPSLGVTIDGPMAGIVGTYSYQFNPKGIFSTSIRYSAGNLDYDGSTWGGTPLKADTDDSIFEWRALIGGDFFIGIGYRYWNNDSNALGSYKREIQYLYSPVGFRYNKPMSENWTWGIKGEYDIFWGGKVKSYLSDVNPGFNDPEVDQDAAGGYGLRFSLRFDRKFAQNHTLSIEPYIRYWDIDTSSYAPLTFNGALVGSVYEPANDTTSYGVRVSFGF